MPQPAGFDACGQAAHAPDDAGDADFTETAKTDRHFSTRSPPHDGHLGTSLPRIRNSNLFPHPWHSYSNNGISRFAPNW